MAEFKKAFNEKKAAIDTQVKTAESLKNILCRGQPGCATGAKPVKGCRGVGVTPDIDEIYIERERAYEKIVVAAVVILVILAINR